jgi:hypothetical protein
MIFVNDPEDISDVSTPSMEMIISTGNIYFPSDRASFQD